MDEFISGPLLRLWGDWDRAWADLLGELIDGEQDGFQAAGRALAEVGRVVVRADEFRGRDLSDLLAPKVPNLLVNCPPLPAPGEVLVRLRAMASDTHFHTPTPPLAAGLIVAAADGGTADSLAELLAEVAGSARLRDAFGWFAFVRDRLLPPPGPPVNGAYTRTEAAPVVRNLDLHDLGRAEGLLPGRLGGHIEVEDEVTAAVGLDTDAAGGRACVTSPEMPLVPWTPGTFAARVRSLAGRLRAWHENPFGPPIVAFAAGDPAAVSKNGETFRDATRPHVGRPEPVRPSADAGETSGEPFDERAATLWLMGEVERQLGHAPPGVVSDFLRGLIEDIHTRPAWVTVTPSQDTPPLAFLAQRGWVVVAGRRVDDALLLGLEDAATRLLVPSSLVGGAMPANPVARATGRKKGRPPLPEDEAKSNKTLYLNWKAVHKRHGTSKEQYVQQMGLGRLEGVSAIESGRYLVRMEKQQAEKKSSG